MPSPVGSKSEQYKLFRLALKTSVEEGNIQFATRAIYRMCLLYVDEFPELSSLVTESKEFIEELVAKGNFKSRDLKPEESLYFGKKAQRILHKFSDYDIDLKLGEEDDVHADYELPEHDEKPDESKLS